MPKKELSDISGQSFDLKFMLVASPGVGKTHLAGTYSGGPVHFYMADPGGEKTLYKLNHNRPKESPITVDTFLRTSNHTYETFWETLQKDEKDGFFEEMASKNGLVVFDSGTSLGQLALDSIAKKNKRTPGNSPETGGMRRQDWGQRAAWMTELLRTISDFPCAAILNVHLRRVVNEVSGAVTESLNLPGQLGDSGANWFDEVYKLRTVVKTQRLFFKSDGTFDQAKTRVFTDESTDFKRGEPILDKLVEAYFQGGKFLAKASPGEKPQAKSKT